MLSLLYSLVLFADGRQLVELLDPLYQRLAGPDMLPLLYNMAEKANEGLRQRRYTKTLLVPYLQVAASFQPRFSRNDSQEIFLQSFVNTLLEGIDEKTRTWLITRAWPAELSLAWKNYVSQQAFHTLAPPSRDERLSMWWEWKVARKKMDRALQSQDDEKIIQVCIEHMTILTGEKAQLLPNYRNWLNEAWRSVLLPQGQIYWWDQTKPQPLLPELSHLAILETLQQRLPHSR